MQGIGESGEILGLFGYFFAGGTPTYFGLGRGPITPPGPAMVRKDLNSNKTKQAESGAMPDTIMHKIL